MTENGKSSVKASRQLHTAMRKKSQEDGVKEMGKKLLEQDEQDVQKSEEKSEGGSRVQ